MINGVTEHTLSVANDNDFLATIADPFKLPGDPTRGTIANPSQFFVFAFDNADLPGFVPQRIKVDHGGGFCADGHDDHPRGDMANRFKGV